MSNVRWPRLPSDSQELIELIDWLFSARFFVGRHTQYHLKIHHVVNYWPTTGRIMVDGQPPLTERGPDALKAFLLKRFPHKQPSSDIGAPGSGAARSVPTDAIKSRSYVIGQQIPAPWEDTKPKENEAVVIELLPNPELPPPSEIILVEFDDAVSAQGKKSHQANAPRHSHK